jgi:hypothetical protein
LTVVHGYLSDGAPMSGYMLTNKLSYLSDIMPDGWEKAVELKATNRIMGEAVRMMTQHFNLNMRRQYNAKTPRTDVLRHFAVRNVLQGAG